MSYPKSIFLQRESVDEPYTSDVTWCETKINNTDVQYIKKTEMYKLFQENSKVNVMNCAEGIIEMIQNDSESIYCNPLIEEIKKKYGVE